MKERSAEMTVDPSPCQPQCRHARLTFRVVGLDLAARVLMKPNGVHRVRAGLINCEGISKGALRRVRGINQDAVISVPSNSAILAKHDASVVKKAILAC